MLGKIIAGLLIAATASFAMSLTELNKASKDELMKINGVGEVKASSIIKERKKGKFKSFDGLSSRVEGVGEQISSNVKNDIKVGDTPKAVSKSKKSKTTSKTKESKSKMSKESDKVKDKAKDMKSKASDKKKDMTKKKDRKIKSVDKKKKELKTKAKKTKAKKSKASKKKTKN